MSHPYDKTADCQCARCVKERARRAAQAAQDDPRSDGRGVNRYARRVRARRNASRSEQQARYLDCGPQAWDDR